MDSDEAELPTEMAKIANNDTANVSADDIHAQNNVKSEEASPNKDRSKVFENSNLTGNFNRIKDMDKAGLTPEIMRATFLYANINLSEGLIEALVKEGDEITGKPLPKKAVKDAINTFNEVQKESEPPTVHGILLVENESAPCAESEGVAYDDEEDVDWDDDEEDVDWDDDEEDVAHDEGGLVK